MFDPKSSNPLKILRLFSTAGDMAEDEHGDTAQVA
jgi:hypothetical protein